MKCKLTGEEITEKHYRSSVGYDLTFGNYTVEIFYCDRCKDRLNFSHVEYHTIKGFIANNIWPARSFIHSKECTNYDQPVDSVSIVLEDFIPQLTFPKTVQEKLDNLLQILYTLQNVDGERIFVKNTIDCLWIKGYFKTPEELIHYIKGLDEDGFIQHTPNGYEPLSTAVNFTMKGLKEVSQKRIINVNNTKDCFIAMAFDEKTIPIREAIKRAISSIGFNPVIIDEVHLPSDKTIPDGIMSAIRNSRFVIADFSLHKNGVYFESGFAVGMGKPVIYLCEEQQFNDAHFDTKQLQHILYKSSEDLEARLEAKIREWIK